MNALQKQKRKWQRDTLKKIESYLHPKPEPLNGFDILHRHTGQYIEFTAWKNDSLRTDRLLKLHRSVILHNKYFYNNHLTDFKWLTSQ